MYLIPIMNKNTFKHWYIDLFDQTFIFSYHKIAYKVFRGTAKQPTKKWDNPKELKKKLYDAEFIQDLLSAGKKQLASQFTSHIDTPMTYCQSII